MSISVSGISAAASSDGTNYSSEISKLQQEKLQYETDLQKTTDDSEKKDIQEKIDNIETQISNLKQKEKSSSASDDSSGTTKAADVDKNTNSVQESKSSVVKNVVTGSLEETSSDGDRTTISRQGQLYSQNQGSSQNKNKYIYSDSTTDF